MQSDGKTRRMEREKQRGVENSKTRKRENNLGIR
jgi:hypothetical protein